MQKRFTRSMFAVGHMARRWVLIPIGAFLMVVIAVTGFLVLNLVAGYWYLLALFVASVLLFMISMLGGSK